MNFTRREIIKHASLFCLATMLGCAKKANLPWDIKEKEFEIFLAKNDLKEFAKPIGIMIPKMSTVVAIIKSK